MEHNNLSTMIFLVNSEVRAVAATYEDIDLSKDTTKMKYNPEYLSGGKLPKGAVVFKTMDPKMAVNDFVIVPTNTRHGMTVCKVVAVDVEIDYSSMEECHWIIGTIDTNNFERLRQEEDRMIQAVKAAKVNDKREQLRASLLGSLKGREDAIPMLTAPVNSTEGKGG